MLENGTRVLVTIYMRNGEPMTDHGTVFMKDNVAYVTFDDYLKYDENGVPTSHLIPLGNYIGYKVLNQDGTPMEEKVDEVVDGEAE